MLYETHDLPGSIAALKTALRAQPKQERQGRVHFNAVMAQRQHIAPYQKVRAVRELGARAQRVAAQGG
ncbi:hypothetical protein [Streptomyces sp. NBC_01506]|uniref:hypothetical protein n=1 Tax=Streptomyces sp. NBC_01506 TaxID=2903887 RepID=UPI0038654813